MKKTDITLKDLYENWYGEKYEKGTRKNKGDFARRLNQNQSIICKMTLGQYKCNARSKKWIELKEFVKINYNKILISESPVDLDIEKLKKKVNRLEKEIEVKDKEISDLKNILQDLVKSVRIMASAKDAVKYGEFKSELYKKEEEK